ncbi:MAG TPA: hypothetical protein VMF89_34620 [Polyangiales bacterium]|nr:hypothetical protein [Polyangiales bacterium]
MLERDSLAAPLRALVGSLIGVQDAITMLAIAQTQQLESGFGPRIAAKALVHPSQIQKPRVALLCCKVVSTATRTASFGGTAWQHKNKVKM